MPKSSFFNGRGNPMSISYAKVPLAYTPHRDGDRQLVIMEAKPSRVALAWRRETTGKIGRIRHVPLRSRNGRKGFQFKNVFVSFAECALVG